MRRVIFRFCLAYGMLTSLHGSLADEPQKQWRYEVRRLAVDANEGAAIADVDGDGLQDVIAGRNWYRNPGWEARPLRLIEDWNGYVQSNGDYIYDVNRDGRPDVIAGSFIPSEVHWYENPGAEGLRLGKTWAKHLLIDTGRSANEGQLFEDLDGDGQPEWIVNSWLKDVPTLIWRLTPTDNTEKPLQMVPVILGEKANGHGIGVGDLNGDGRKDILVGQGWYEQPAIDPWKGNWEFHPDWDLQASLPMLVRDLNGDGRNDIVYGNGHNYGLFWWEQLPADENGKLQWKEHLIDRGFSQPHSMVFVDLNGDGVEELITGKRYFAHNGGDPGANEPTCLYYYTWDIKEHRFTRHVINEGQVGTGLQIAVGELNGDGIIDIAVAGKSGTHVILSEKQ